MDPVTIITTTLGFIGTAIKSYNVIKEIKDLPEAFREVERQLPLVHKVLTNVSHRLISSQITDADKIILRDQLSPCEKDAKTLNEIFEKLADKFKADQNDTKTWAKACAWYREALRGMKARRVEGLMKTILERVKLLTSNEIFGMRGDLDHIMEALDEISKVKPSLDDFELETGPISQTIRDNARGTQNNIYGGIVNTGDNSGNTFGNVETLNFNSYVYHDPSTQSTGQSAATPQSYDKSRPIHFIPLHENENFVGRVEIIKKLQAMLEGKKHQRVALHGLGGVGKTQIALSLAYWAQENLPKYSIFWLSALSTANFEQSCRDLIDDVGLPCLQDQNPQDVLRNFLSSEDSGFWLLVVDNLDDENIVSSNGGFNSCFPKPKDKRSLIIFTTRSRKIARDLSNFNVLQLQEMNKDEAKTLLERLLGPHRLQDEDTTITSLLDELTCLPLAINHAAAYIDQNGISAKAYFNLMRTSERDLVELLDDNFSSEHGDGKSQNAVATTWLLSFESIRNSDPQAGVLLEFLSQIEPKAISRCILPEFETKQQQIRAIGTLKSYAFITERSNEEFDMHSLVHLGAKVWVERQGQEYAKRLITSCMVRLEEVLFGEGMDFEDLTRFGDEHLPHALKLLRASEDHGMNCELGVVLQWKIGAALLIVRPRPCPEGVRLLRQALQLAEDGNFDQLVSALQVAEATAILEESFAVENPSNHEEMERGVKLAENAIEAYKLAPPAENRSSLLAQLTLAGLYIFTDRQMDAIPLIDSAFETYTTVYMYQDRLDCWIAPSLARRLVDIGRTSAAIEVIEKTIEKHNVVIGRCTMPYIVMQGWLASLYFDLDPHDTQSIVDRSEHIWRLVVNYYGGISHLKVVQFKTMLGLAYKFNGQYTEATSVLQEVAKLCEQDTALANSWFGVQTRSSLVECAAAELDVAEGEKAGIRGAALLRISAKFKAVSRRLVWNRKRGEKSLY